MGKQRLGINLISLMVALREEARLPFRIIQWYLEAAHGLRLSLGAIVAATQKVAQRAQGALSDIVARIRGSPVVHADETGWREDGHNGYVWTFSTPTERYFLRRGRSKAVVAEALGEEFAGALVSDFYAAYHHYDGPKQRCWAHLLRDIHDLRALYPDDVPLGGGRTPSTMCTKKPKPSPTRRNGSAAGPNWPWNNVCWPSAVLAWTTRQRRKPSCAAGWRSTSKNSSSSWPKRQSHRTTTPPSAACVIWWSAARSAAEPAHRRGLRPR